MARPGQRAFLLALSLCSIWLSREGARLEASEGLPKINKFMVSNTWRGVFQTLFSPVVG